MSMTSSVESLSFENALLELEKIVKVLESGAGDLEASISEKTCFFSVNRL